MSKREELVFVNPYLYNGQKSLWGMERLVGVISRANQMGYVYGKDFEIGFERGDDINSASPAFFVIYKGSAAEKDSVLKGYMRGLSKFRSAALTAAAAKWEKWTDEKDFPGYSVFKHFDKDACQYQ